MVVVYLLRSCICHYYHGMSIIYKLKNKSCNKQNRRSGEISNLLFDTYKSSVKTHGKHILKTAYDMDMATMRAYPSFKYALPNWNFFR